MFFLKKLLPVSIGIVSSSLISIPQLNKNLFIELPNRSSSALAQTVEGYVPPPRPISRTQRRDGSGSRGCNNSKAIATSLTLLVPSDHIPTTAFGRPTFLWYLSNTVSAPVIFTLVDQQSFKPILKQRLKVEKSGIMQLQLPSNVAPLVEGKQYRWTVAIVCNEQRPSENTYAFAWIQRVPLTPELTQKLARATNRQERALILAQAGLWYDAVSTLYKTSLKDSNKRTAFNAADSFSGLLKQVGLSQVIDQKEQISTRAK